MKKVEAPKPKQIVKAVEQKPEAKPVAVVVSNSSKRITKVDGTEEQNKLVQIAYDKCSIDCVITFQGESDWITLRHSNAPNKKGKLAGSMDMGICQMNWQFHYDFIFDLSKSEWLGKLNSKEIEYLKHSYEWDDRTMYNRMKNEFNRLWKAGYWNKDFKNPYTQLNRCLDMWGKAKKAGNLRTTWYAWNNIVVEKYARRDLTAKFIIK